MAYKINSDCTSCGACVGACPVDAIVAGDGQYKIEESCFDCGSCVSSCPAGAIVEN